MKMGAAFGRPPQGGAAAKPPPPLVGCGRRPHPFFIKMLSKSPLQDVRGPRGHPAEDFLTTFGRLLKIAESAAAEDLQRTFIHFGDAISVEELEVVTLGGH